MPIHPVPLAQTATARGWEKAVGTSAKDAQIINGLFEVSTNPLLGTKTVSVQKRGGSTSGTVIGSSGEAKILKVRSSSLQLFISDSSFNLYDDEGSNLGVIGSFPQTNNLNVADACIANTSVYAFAAGGSGWFLYEDAINNNFPTFSASLTTGQATIVGIASTTGIHEGQAVAGSGVPVSTRVEDIINSSMVLLSQTVTESGTKTITKEAVSLITDSTLSGVTIVSIVFLDGRFFASDASLGTTGGKIYQSALNDPSSWDSADVITADYSGDQIRCLFKIKDYIVAAGTGGTIQYFYNAGNATGSVLSPAENFTVTGLTLRGEPVFTESGGYFIASTENSSDENVVWALYRITGVNEITKVSDHVWSGIITDSFYQYINTAVIGNRQVIILNTSFTAPSSVCLVYDPSVNQFTLLQLASGEMTSSFGRRFTKNGSTSTFQWATGNTWTDSSEAYTLTIQTEPQDMAQGLSTTDTWVDLLADVEASGTATIDVSDNDYGSWVNKGSFDMTKNKKRVSALGFHDGPRAYRIQHSANTGFRGQILRVNHQPSSL